MTPWNLGELVEDVEHFFVRDRPCHVVLFVENVGIILKPHAHERAKLMVTVTVGHKINCSIGFLDTNGNPMLATPAPDAVPSWSNTTPASETLVPAGDGLTAVATALAAGSDQINLSLTVGGKVFQASLSVAVQAAPQTLGSVAINSTVA
jgi:hypothetical protein